MGAKTNFLTILVLASSGIYDSKINDLDEQEIRQDDLNSFSNQYDEVNSEINFDFLDDISRDVNIENAVASFNIDWPDPGERNKPFGKG